jgi:hypothetical protein
MISDIINALRLVRSRKDEQRARDEIYAKYRDRTMVPRVSFDSNLSVVQTVKPVQGCVVECGVWKGGMSGAIAEVLGAGRTYYLFDSFEGLPEAQSIDGEAAAKWQADKSGAYYFDNCSASQEEALDTMKRSPAARVVPVKGWFEATVPEFVLNERIALLRLDGDWYESTMICLKKFFPLMVEGGKIIIDDYYTWDGCSRAVHDYLSEVKATERIMMTPEGVAYLTKVPSSVADD